MIDKTETFPQRTALNGSKGLRAVEAVRVICTGLADDEWRTVLRLLETISAELKQQGKVVP